jgi:hypothetical protein
MLHYCGETAVRRPLYALDRAVTAHGVEEAVAGLFDEPRGGIIPSQVGHCFKDRWVATTMPTIEEILQDVRQLPEPQRRKLLREIEALPRSEGALHAARKLRGKYRLGARKRQRMSELLSRGNAGTLTSAEKRELNGLVSEFEQQTLALAEAIVRSVQDDAHSSP